MNLKLLLLMRVDRLMDQDFFSSPPSRLQPFDKDLNSFSRQKT